jgi:hypothetical protein
VIAWEDMTSQYREGLWRSEASVTVGGGDLLALSVEHLKFGDDEYWYWCASAFVESDDGRYHQAITEGGRAKTMSDAKAAAVLAAKQVLVEALEQF